MQTIPHPSPNFNERLLPLQYVMIHHTDTQSAEDALAILTQKGRLPEQGGEVSAHYCIARDGRLFQLVDDDKRAWHAGKGNWQGITDMNSASIGIELENPGYSYGMQPFPDVQIDQLIGLLNHLVLRHTIHPHHIIGHSDYAPGRKADPGHTFPWADLARLGLGLWPTKKVVGATITEAESNDILARLGYDIANPKALSAFQLHFCPAERDRGLTQATQDLLAGF